MTHNLAQLWSPGAVYSVLAVIACAAPRLTFQLYGIIPVPAWLVVSGVFAWDSYNTINDSVSVAFPPLIPAVPHHSSFQAGTTDSIGHVGGLLAGVGYYLSRRFRIF
jgi:membrane associated rhomboid family serine protease